MCELPGAPSVFSILVISSNCTYISEITSDRAPPSRPGRDFFPFEPPRTLFCFPRFFDGLTLDTTPSATSLSCLRRAAEARSRLGTIWARIAFSARTFFAAEADIVFSRQAIYPTLLCWLTVGQLCFSVSYATKVSLWSLRCFVGSERRKVKGGTGEPPKTRVPKMTNTVLVLYSTVPQYSTSLPPVLYCTLQYPSESTLVPPLRWTRRSRTREVLNIRYS